MADPADAAPDPSEVFGSLAPLPNLAGQFPIQLGGGGRANFEFDPADRPNDGSLMRALKRAFRGESPQSFEEMVQELRQNPPIDRWQKELVSSVGNIANEYIWLLLAHLLEASESGDENLELQIGRHIAKWFKAVVVVQEQVTTADWIRSQEKAWDKACDQIEAEGEAAFHEWSPKPFIEEDRFAPDVPTDLPPDLVTWFRGILVARLVRERLAEVFPDGPGEPLLFVYKNKPYAGLTDKPWRLLNHLWKQRPTMNKEGVKIRSSHFDNLADPVLAITPESTGPVISTVIEGTATSSSTSTDYLSTFPRPGKPKNSIEPPSWNSGRPPRNSDEFQKNRNFPRRAF
jgi:hypothetical protein